MTTTTGHIHNDDARFAECQIRFLENEVRSLRENLRDKFAMAAVTGLLADPAGTDYLITEIAADAYDLADALLKARNK